MHLCTILFSGDKFDIDILGRNINIKESFHSYWSYRN